MDEMAQSISHFLASKSTPFIPNTQLKHYEMWANYDKMISKLDDESIEDLNIELMTVIGNAVKAHRQKTKEQE